MSRRDLVSTQSVFLLVSLFIPLLFSQLRAFRCRAGLGNLNGSADFRTENCSRQGQSLDLTVLVVPIPLKGGSPVFSMQRALLGVQ